MTYERARRRLVFRNRQGGAFLRTRADMLMNERGLFFIACILVASWGGPAAAAPWSPPLGIPAPSFGITQVAPAAPSPWTTATAGFYYVDEAAAGATDTTTPTGRQRSRGGPSRRLCPRVPSSRCTARTREATPARTTSSLPARQGSQCSSEGSWERPSPRVGRSRGPTSSSRTSSSTRARAAVVGRSWTPPITSLPGTTRSRARSMPTAGSGCRSGGPATSPTSSCCGTTSTTPATGRRPTTRTATGPASTAVVTPAEPSRTCGFSTASTATTRATACRSTGKRRHQQDPPRLRRPQLVPPQQTNRLLDEERLGCGLRRKHDPCPSALGFLQRWRDGFPVRSRSSVVPVQRELRQRRRHSAWKR